MDHIFQAVDHQLALNAMRRAAEPPEAQSAADSLEVRQAIARGRAEGLTRDEARDWIEDGEPRPVLVWWARHYLPPDAHSGARDIQSWDVARWLQHVVQRGGWGAMVKEHVFYGPARKRYSMRAIEALRYIEGQDLVNGQRTSVDKVIKHVNDRLGEQLYQRFVNDHRVLNTLPRGWRLPPEMTFLDTPASQVRYGKDLGVCMLGGVFVPSTEDGTSVTLGIEVPGECKSAAEMSRKGFVYQHVGPKNKDPIEPCLSIFNRFAASVSPTGRYEGYGPGGVVPEGLEEDE